MTAEDDMPTRSTKLITIIAALSILTLLLVTLGLRIAGAATAERSRSTFVERWGSLDPASFEAEPLAATANAATWLQAGAAAIVLDDDQTKLLGSLSASTAETWTEDDLTRAEALIDRNREALATLARALPLEWSSWGVAYAEAGATEMPKLLEVLSAARLILVEGRLRLAQGDATAALHDLRLLATTARSLESESLLIIGLVGVAIERMQLVLGAEMAAAPGIPSEVREACADTILTTDLTEDGRRMLRFETACAVERWRGGVPEPEAGPLDRFLGKLFRGWVVHEIVVANEPWMERLPVPFGEGAWDATVERPPWWHLPAAMAYISQPNLAATVVRFQSVAALRQRLRAALELRRLADLDGAYPEHGAGVAELAVPEALTGRPIAYHRREDGSAVLELTGAAQLVHGFMAGAAIGSLEPLVLPAGV